MHFTTAFLTSAAALTASALPQTTPVSEGTAFGVITIRSGSEIQNSGVQAARSSLLVNAQSQNASCDADSNFATFYIKDEELHLYESKTSARPQTIFVDRSGMGMGKIGYVTGAEPLGKNWETKGWTVDNNELKFKETGIQACPGSIDGAWSVWLQGVDKPAYLEGCVGVTGSVIKTDSPIGCWYTE
ncbi:uncharacterized protein N0V89_009603 [Didymosphaeria variabile]|uniref:Cell wall protein PhiA n=1 Tax=Didymosphaeria variabile TaxID=1932322 RepID=A0A9W8XFD6_9PLEO|nr:uncharacterized protein N0V89_009603 [Didymosphaeria variabile]KAJ4348231.1 hypothetical protein N0V89_009603 [Didymosphaeria variabile]